MTASVLSPRPMTRGDSKPLADTLTQAFANEPLHQWMVPDAQAWASKAPRYFASYVKIVRRDGLVDTVEDAQGVACWLTPQNPAGGMISRFTVPFVIWRLAGSRFPNVWNALPKIDEHRPQEPHWYLDILGTSPQHAGAGIGSALLNHGLKRCDQSGEAVFLATLTQRSVDFYERFGFQVTSSFSLPDGPTGWAMVRPASKAA